MVVIPINNDSDISLFVCPSIKQSIISNSRFVKLNFSNIDLLLFFNIRSVFFLNLIKK